MTTIPCRTLFSFLGLALALVLFGLPQTATAERVPDKILSYLVIPTPSDGPAASESPPPGLTLKKFESILTNIIYQEAVAQSSWTKASDNTWQLELKLIPGKSPQQEIQVLFTVDDAKKRCGLTSISEKGKAFPSSELFGLYGLIVMELKSPSGK